MVSGGLLAVIVAATIGTNAETDGFFAAFAIYATVAAFAQTSRTTIVARLLEGSGRFTAFNEYLGAGTVPLRWSSRSRSARWAVRSPSC